MHEKLVRARSMEHHGGLLDPTLAFTLDGGLAARKASQRTSEGASKRSSTCTHRSVASTPRSLATPRVAVEALSPPVHSRADTRRNSNGSLSVPGVPVVRPQLQSPG